MTAKNECGHLIQFLASKGTYYSSHQIAYTVDAHRVLLLKSNHGCCAEQENIAICRWYHIDFFRCFVDMHRRLRLLQRPGRFLFYVLGWQTGSWYRFSVLGLRVLVGRTWRAHHQQRPLWLVALWTSSTGAEGCLCQFRRGPLVCQIRLGIRWGQPTRACNTAQRSCPYGPVDPENREAIVFLMKFVYQSHHVRPLAVPQNAPKSGGRVYPHTHRLWYSVLFH